MNLRRRPRHHATPVAAATMLITLALVAASLGRPGATTSAPSGTSGVGGTGPAAPGVQPAAAAMVEDLIGQLSVETKVGQLMMVAFPGPAPTDDVVEMIEQHHAGGVILFQDNVGRGGPERVHALTESLQRHARGGGGGDPGLPLLVAADQEGGPVVRVAEGATVFPGNMALGATLSDELVARAAATTAAELRAMGINVNLGPVVDVNSNPLNPVIGTRSFGADPALVARLAAAAIRATQDAGILAVAKHYPGHGDVDVDSHLALPVLPHTPARLAAVELPPFQSAVASGVSGVMTAHLAVPALEPDLTLPASLSPRVVGALRELTGDDRLIISDDLEMGAVLERFGTAEAAKMALQAGSDILLFRRNAAEQRRAHALLTEAVRAGEIPIERLDASVRRILRAKAVLGLLGPAELPPSLALAAVGGPADQAVATEVSRQALTLVRNEGGLLPLQLAPGQRLCVVSPRPAEVARWEIMPVLPAGAGTLAGALAARYPLVEATEVGLRPTASDREAAGQCARRAAAVIAGTYNVQTFPEQAELVNDLLDSGAPVAVVALRLPFDLQYLPEVPAFLAAYSYRPPAVQAAAAALLGQGEPMGHLPVPLGDSYPLGFGLRYAQ